MGRLCVHGTSEGYKRPQREVSEASRVSGGEKPVQETEVS
jgi:hypothetical protein